MNFEDMVSIYKELLLHKDFIELNFKGSSMIPTIPYNSLIKVKAAKSIVEGKIYLYSYINTRTFDRMVAHRLISIHNNQYIFKGDNRKEPDSPITRPNIIGEVFAWNNNENCLS